MPKKITIVNWNIDSGGQPEKILDAIRKYSPNICIFTEFRCDTEAGREIQEKLSSHFNLHSQAVSRKDKGNGVLIASDDEINEQEMPDRSNNELQKLLLSIKTHGINVIGIFCRNDEATDTLFSSFDSLPSYFLTEDTLLAGDFNYGPRSSDKSRYQKLRKLTERGWKDVWRLHYGDKITESSWTHKNKAFLRIENKGFSLVDHFFASRSLSNCVKHKPVNDQNVMTKTNDDEGCSDHSMIIMEVVR